MQRKWVAMRTNEIMRWIPSVEQLATQVKNQQMGIQLHHDVIIKLLRATVAEFRQQLLFGNDNNSFSQEAAVHAWIRNRFAQKVAKLTGESLKKTINATGVVLHTNLGRAPLCKRARDLVLSVMEGYSTLEYDTDSGGRGERYNHVERRLTELTGAEAALAVNNNAAAVMLALGGVARGREVLVSRGELVEIGGSFRIPDVIKQSGAVLVEVGATNKTHLQDYTAAITPATAAILKVHTSNFSMVGFTGQPEMSELCRLARENNLVSINDVGSGTLLALTVEGTAEPTVQECIAAGFDLVTFSGDKLLGAGQAGLIAGKKTIMDKLKKEPLLRALRIDKMSLAALEGTLIEYATGLAELKIPVWHMLQATPERLQEKAAVLAASLQLLNGFGWQVRVIKTKSLAGGGSLPGVELDGYGIEIETVGKSAGDVAKQLRTSATPVVCLVREAALIFDVRCLLPGDEAILIKLLLGIASGESS